MCTALGAASKHLMAEWTVVAHNPGSHNSPHQPSLYLHPLPSTLAFGCEEQRPFARRQLSCRAGRQIA
jgi:hypothetical protein